MAKTIGSTKIQTKKRRTTKKTKSKKTVKAVKPVKNIKPTETSNPRISKYSTETRSLMMWILVGIFTVIFVALAIFSFTHQINNTDEENDKSFFSIFDGMSESTSKIVDNFKNIRVALFGEEEEIEVTDEKLNEWENKLFIDFNQE